MAENNALTFYVKFMEDKQSSIEALVKQVKDTFEKTQIHLKGENIKIDGLEKTFNSVTNLLEQVEKKFKETGNISMGGNLETSFNNLADAISKVASAVTSLETRIAGFSSSMSTSIVNAIVGNMENLGKATQKAKQALNEFNKEESKTKGITSKVDVKAYNDEATRLRKIYTDLNKVRSEALYNSKDKHALMNTAQFQELERLIQLTRDYIRWVNEAKRAGASLGDVQSKYESFASTDPSKAAAAMEQLVQNQRSAVISTNQVAQAQERMGQAMQSAIDKASQQSQILGDLKSMAAQYLSVWGAYNFAKEVANITGELQLQQKSLEVIIGSAGKAQELYNDIKAMSQMSPNTFQNLIKTTKQLAAFGIETKDLFKTMKQLSDIGAGLDVDVQRLVLAYGHIKSAGVLQGIQRRQLETAGIGITAELAKMYNEQYRMAGSDERVSAEDVFKRIKDRQVSFEDVEKVFNRLAGPGGKFENMQLRQYETLGGKLRNLRNNYNIMMDEMGRSYMEWIMGVVDGMNSIMENWRKWKSLIVDVGVALAAVKVAQMALGKSFVAHRAATMSMKRSAQDTLIVSNIGTAAPLPPIRKVTQSTLDETYAQKINDSNLNKFQKARAVMYNNVTASARQLLLLEQGFNPMYAERVAQLKGWRLGMQRLKMSAMSFFSTMRMGFISLATNPMTWIMAAVAGFTALIQKGNEIEEQSKSLQKGFQTMGEDAKELTNILKEVGTSIGYETNNGKSKLDVEKLYNENPKVVLEKLDSEMQKFDPLYKGHLVDINAMQSDVDKVLAMMDILNNQKLVSEKLVGQGGLFMAANKSTGVNATFMNAYGLDDWILGRGKWDTFLDEAKEFEEEFTKVVIQIQTNREAINKKLEKVATGELHVQDKELRDQIDEIIKISEAAGVDLATAMETYVGKANISEAFNKEGKRVKAGFIALFEDVEDEYGNSVDAFTISTMKMLNKMEGLKSKMAPMIAPIVSAMKDFASVDKDGSLRATYVANAIDQILNNEEKPITDKASRDAIKHAMIEMVEQFATEGLPPEVAQEWRDSVFSQLWAGDANVEASNMIDDMIAQGILNGGEPSPEAIAKVREKWEGVIAKATVGEDEETAKKIADVHRRAMDKAIKNLTGEDLKEWQKRIKSTLSLARFDDIKTKIGLKVGVEANLSEFSDDVRKKVKELKETATNLARTIKINSKMNIKFDVDVLMGDMKKLEEFYMRLKMYYVTQRAAGMLNKDARKNADETEELLKGLEKLLDIKKIEKATGYDLTTDPKEEAKKNKEAESAAEKAKRAREKAAREREKAAEEARRKEVKHYENLIDMIAKLRAEYKRLRSDGYGKEGAMEETKAYYDRMFKGQGLIEWEKLNKEDITSVSPYLEGIGKLIDASQRLKQEDKDSLKKRALEQLMQAENVGFKERSDEALNEFNKALDSATEGFNRLREILKATGDAELAGEVSGYGRGAAAGKLSSMISEELEMWLGLKLGDKYKDIDYDEVAKLNEKGIEEYVSELFGEKDTAYIVKAVSQALKEYRKAIKNENKDALAAYTKAISSALDYESQKARIEWEFKDAMLKIKESGLTEPEKRKAIAVETSRKDLKLLELSNNYKRFFDGIFAEPMDEMRSMADTIKRTYIKALETGAITAEEYAKKIDEVNRVMEEAENHDMSQWWNKGFFDTRSMENRIKEMRDKGQDMISQGSQMYQDAIAKGDKEGASKGLGMMQNGQNIVNKANGMAKALTIIDAVITQVDKSIQGTVKAFNYLKEAMDALGMESDTMEAMSDYLSAISEMSSHVKSSWDSFKNGDMMGASVEAIGAITALITGFAQAHDNRLQRKIDDIKLDTEKMSNTLDTIKALRERELGYDSGNLRRRLASGYSAESAMYEYYSRYSSGSGYEQELKLLEEQKQKIMEMYDLENRKKKKSKEDLEDYKKQIADLDEQIMFYMEDLAKELWGIDIKGWADQLGDALMTAFENGTSAASAFKDTVQDIMRDMVKNMMVVGVIEPAMKSLQEKLFGTDGKGGVFGNNGGVENASNAVGAVLSELGNWFNSEGPRLMDAANEFYNGADNMMRQILGYGMRESEKSTNTVNSITSTASEETMGVVAGYLARISQDVSVQRIIQEMYVNGTMPSFIEQVTTVNDSLTAIDRSTTAMMEMMRDGNGALYERVENMSRRLDNFANGIDRIYVN